MSRSGSASERETVLWLTLFMELALIGGGIWLIYPSNGRSGHKSVRNLVSILQLREYWDFLWGSPRGNFLWGSPRGICFCTEPQKLKAGSVSRNPPTETIGHARAGGEKALTSIASAATIRR
jgi:hypothetical protein